MTETMERAPEISDFTEASRTMIAFTEVTLRDGEQQEKRYPVMPIKDRRDVFDAAVATGIDRFEVGHLGNEHDIELTKSLVPHIDARTCSGDIRYERIDLQALFGTQTDLVEPGLQALEGFDKDRVVLHFYDRVSPSLRALAQEEYSTQDSAQRVIEASMIALRHGYTRFSISGEGAVDPNLPMDEVIEDFYVPVAAALDEAGATEINVNLANTFGESLNHDGEGEWTREGLAYFNNAVKEAVPGVTTSVHTHNDNKDAAEFAFAAVLAGFDRVEGTMTGMGERAGNVALVDVMERVLENARRTTETIDNWDRISHAARVAMKNSVWINRRIEPEVAEALPGWYGVSAEISDIYDTDNRFHSTSVGNPEAYDAGSGPHAHANQEALKDPVNKPLWKNYARIALIHAAMGRPEAIDIIEVNPERYLEITLKTHAGGGSTGRIRNGEVDIAPVSERKKAAEIARSKIADIVELASGSTN